MAKFINVLALSHKEQVHKQATVVCINQQGAKAYKGYLVDKSQQGTDGKIQQQK